MQISRSEPEVRIKSVPPMLIHALACWLYQHQHLFLVWLTDYFPLISCPRMLVSDKRVLIRYKVAATITAMTGGTQGRARELGSTSMTVMQGRQPHFWGWRKVGVFTITR